MANLKTKKLEDKLPKNSLKGQPNKLQDRPNKLPDPNREKHKILETAFNQGRATENELQKDKI